MTLTGTDAAEMLTGTAGNDTIFGLGGGDTLQPDLGNDLVFSVTSRYYQDRRGNIYKDTVYPHIKVQQPENVSEDALIAAAKQWLVVPDDNAVTASILKKDQ